MVDFFGAPDEPGDHRSIKICYRSWKDIPAHHPQASTDKEKKQHNQLAEDEEKKKIYNVDRGCSRIGEKG